MKKFLLLIIFVLTLYTVSATCVVKCVDKNTNMSCTPDSDSCVYDIESGVCPGSGAFDNDLDGWHNGCDAFSEDSSEQMDLDGDGYGYNYDCNDFDASSTTECHTTTTTTGGGGSTTTYCTPTWECNDWSFCENNEKTRTCTKTNSCEGDDHKPVEAQWCYNPTFTKETDEETKQDSGVTEVEPEAETEPEETPEGLSGVTGQAFGFVGGTGNALILLLMLLLLFLFFWKRKKKNQSTKYIK